VIGGESDTSSVGERERERKREKEIRERERKELGGDSESREA